MQRYTQSAGVLEDWTVVRCKKQRACSCIDVHDVVASPMIMMMLFLT